MTCSLLHYLSNQVWGPGHPHWLENGPIVIVETPGAGSIGGGYVTSPPPMAQPQYAAPAYPQGAYGAPPPAAYGQPSGAYGQPAYGQPAYGQPAAPAYPTPQPGYAV